MQTTMATLTCLANLLSLLEAARKVVPQRNNNLLMAMRALLSRQAQLLAPRTSLYSARLQLWYRHQLFHHQTSRRRGSGSLSCPWPRLLTAGIARPALGQHVVSQMSPRAWAKQEQMLRLELVQGRSQMVLLEPAHTFVLSRHQVSGC